MSALHLLVAKTRSVCAASDTCSTLYHILTKELLMSEESQTNTNFETISHILNVQRCMNIVLLELIKRAEDHDATKLESPEAEGFAEVTHKLKGCEYNSEEYKAFLKLLKPALEHHYARNRHHPEHHKDGVEDMNIIDLVEMLCDWKAATLRNRGGNLKKSIEANQDRFGISPQLSKILENSIYLFDDIKE